MDANEQKLPALIQKGEGLDLEFKTCREQLNRNVYETVCAFLNRHGGTLLLGVRDSGEVQGIDPDAVEQIQKDFATKTEETTQTPQVTQQVTPQVGRLLAVVDMEMTMAEIMELLELKDRTHFASNYLQPALDAGFIEMTVRDKPRSSKQKYRLTEQAKKILEKIS